MRALLLKMNMIADVAEPVGGSTHPYYRRSRPMPQNLFDFASDTTHIDFTHANLAPYPPEPVDLAAFTSSFDARGAAAVSNATGFFRELRVFAAPWELHQEDVLLEYKEFYVDGEKVAGHIFVPKGKCLAVLACPDISQKLIRLLN